MHCLAHQVCLANGLYVLLVLMSFFHKALETNYLSIYWTNICLQFFTNCTYLIINDR